MRVESFDWLTVVESVKLAYVDVNPRAGGVPLLGERYRGSQWKREGLMMVSESMRELLLPVFFCAPPRHDMMEGCNI